MNITVGENKLTRVTLSRRNLEHLLQMLDLRVGNPTLKRRTEDGTALFVTAEENDDHYKNREAGPGFDFQKAA